MARVAPYGTWTSPLSARATAGDALRLGAVSIDGDDIYWLEGRPTEGGRYVLVTRGADGRVADVTPAAFNVRTRVHEYGGGAHAIDAGVVFFVNFSDQRIYRQAAAGGHGPPDPEPITPPGAWRYADLVVDARRRRVICVREDHSASGREPENTIVSIPMPAGGGADALSAGDVLVTGDDFYSTPRLSPDGSALTWIAWRHPRMPWDGTELWVAGVGGDGRLGDRERVAGGEDESIYQPGWWPDGTLCFASDRDGWWTLYRADAAGGSRAVRPVLAHPAPATEFGRPEWIFGTATWAWAGASSLAVSYTRAGVWCLGTIDVAAGVLRDVAPGLQPHEWLAATPTHALVVAGWATQPDAVARVELATGEAEILRSASPLPLDAGDISVAEAIEFPTTGGRTAHAFYYPPRNAAYAASADERPPLIVISHGGPTSAASSTLDPRLQFWTSRGFAIVDVNYGGSSGYGRAYRERLNGEWGIVDVDDVINAAGFLAESGRADPRRLVIRGGSAGGYTTLAALAFHPEAFSAGASYYGVSDLEVLELDTHKFESRYSHSLIGPYPERRDLYRERSPIHFVDRLACPLILFQGLEDKVVPPNQSQMMADAVRAKGLPVAYLAFEGEQHGFRKAETNIRCLEAELAFYGMIFGFTPAGPIAPLAVANLRG